MTRSYYDFDTMGETKYTLGGKYKGIPKKDISNWITLFRYANPTKTFDYIFNTPKFKMQSKDYHYMVITYKNGTKHAMLFYKGACCASAHSSYEKI
jgi:hypothetical protein